MVISVVYKPVGEITPYENNPRLNDEAVPMVAASIEQFGFKVPIILDKNGTIIAGHTRLKAAMSLGMETVPCIIADDLTEEQARAFRLADNKVSEAAGWDFDLLDGELGYLSDAFDMEDFGFILDDFIEDFEEALSEPSPRGENIDEEEEPPVNRNHPCQIEPGDVIRLGRHVLRCESCAQPPVLPMETGFALTRPPLTFAP